MKPALIMTLVAFGLCAHAAGNADDRVAIVVAAKDLPAGTVVTLNDLSQRIIPRQLQSSSVVKPDAVNYITDQKLLFPVLMGDPLLWSMFEVTHPEAANQCQASDQGLTAEQQVARIRAALMKKLKKR